MTKEERVQQAKKLVAEQLSNMIVNNLVEGNGFEQFVGWCENGDVFAGEECFGECIELMHKIGRTDMDNILWILAEENVWG